MNMFARLPDGREMTFGDYLRMIVSRIDERLYKLEHSEPNDVSEGTDLPANNYADLKARVEALTRRVEALEGKPQPVPSEPEPAGDGWIQVPHMVWRACAVNGKWVVDLAQHGFLDIGDLWQPYDPQNPTPPNAPKVGGE